MSFRRYILKRLLEVYLFVGYCLAHGYMVKKLFISNQHDIVYIGTIYLIMPPPKKKKEQFTWIYNLTVIPERAHRDVNMVVFVCGNGKVFLS